MKNNIKYMIKISSKEANTNETKLKEKVPWDTCGKELIDILPH